MVYSGLNCDSIMYQGHVEYDKRINLLFDGVTRHYNVIGNLTGAMAKRYVFKGCNKGCRYVVEHTCGQACTDCRVRPPCISARSRIPSELCNRHFRSQTCFDNHKRKPVGKTKIACGLRKCCGPCGAMITYNKREYNKRFCAKSYENKEVAIFALCIQ